MKRLINSIQSLIMLLLLMHASGAQGLDLDQQTLAAGTHSGTYQGWAAIALSNGTETAIFVPEIGRMVALKNTQGHNYLWLNPTYFPKPATLPSDLDKKGKRRWHNYGGFKVWPFPWTGWPPDAALDGANNTAEVHKDSIVLTTPISDTLHLQVQNTFSFGDRGLQIVTSMTRHEGDKNYHIWPVFQVHGSGSVAVPLDPTKPTSQQLASPHVKAEELATVLTAQEAGVFAFQHGAAHRKFDFTTTDGWIEHRDNQHILRLSWDKESHTFPKNFDASAYGNAEASGPQAYFEIECYSPAMGTNNTLSWTYYVVLKAGD